MSSTPPENDDEADAKPSTDNEDTHGQHPSLSLNVNGTDLAARLDRKYEVYSPKRKII